MNPDFSVLGQTGLLPLWGRYQWHLNPLLDFKDPVSERMVKSLDYDFSSIDRKIGGYGIAAWGNRTYQIDQISRAHLLQPQACVVNLGVGLDDPFSRIYQGRGRVLDCDFEDVLNFRDQFIQADPMRTMVRDSFLAFSWVNTVKAWQLEEPLICLAGVSMYLKPEQIEELLRKVYSAFPKAKMVFDALSPWGIQLLNKGMAESELPQEPVFWGLKDKQSLLPCLPEHAVVQIESLFKGLPPGVADFKTQLQIAAANLIGISKLVRIS
ncbi:hypothetical protein COW36_22560 [bacterium (Candidatus Blackallbacteria) CG17_big_fil_post_rev_8_21_14_2_50_48_46]|uniref:Methyltransferase n=1 Tax=bacterium (Candidatus Blackallbacteria) CG17_big_fil_post_rev_8_21_14_2_50_48_46 TaxID=2014261 RepID=A0A2M7FXX4_9BACT|nr:MAG: hypothetical protein COW64_07330 [bacterium (Candidatus Blackallbacteria) CG18_big_fil_WC_8_21_14_2_50_49_26]PIW14162.1 MAG: hypothetical protein COW36_22560 [bacterium (Candidatus Blackallbacteria) CG17_big_fil_post_rev_8_21_14_2_50_48_46]PIW46703.1 MAG: hypothetical protein COW20_14835 [bacterium (Candidatus Blackallbacteria) CG13_big_fil_rev_8_21_14_2_50_49_14]